MHHHHLGVYALIRNAENQLLVIKKARGPYTGLFDLPGGSMEDGELLEETLSREITEETGCTITSHQQLGTVSLRFPYEKDGQPRLLRHVGVVYAATVSGTPTTSPDDLDSDGCLWLSLTEENLQRCSPLLTQTLNLTSITNH